MKISVPVTLTVDVEFDMDRDECPGEELPSPERLGELARQAVVDALHADDVLMDDMVERITDGTGWCILGISMGAA